MQFKINLSNVKLLISVVKDPDLIIKLHGFENAGEYFEKGKYPTGRYVLELSEEESEIITDSLSDHLMTSGLNENDEPNAVGFQVEKLIDVFNADKESIIK